MGTCLFFKLFDERSIDVADVFHIGGSGVVTARFYGLPLAFVRAITCLFMT